MGDVSVLLSEANEQIMNADSKEKLLRLLGTYERILERDPSNYEALWSLGRYNVVMVLGYTESRSEKEKHNLAAINYCEQAMNTHPEFKALSAGGGSEKRILNGYRLGAFSSRPNFDAEVLKTLPMGFCFGTHGSQIFQALPKNLIIQIDVQT